MTEGQQQQKKQTRNDGDKKSEGMGKGHQNGRFRQVHEHTKRDPDAVPILYYGLANNFMRFKEAVSKKTLEEYGNLGKLINQGPIEGPEEPDRSWVDLTNEFDKVEYLEDMRTYQKLKTELDQKKPKLYATILKYLSDESLGRKLVKDRRRSGSRMPMETSSTLNKQGGCSCETRGKKSTAELSSFEGIISYKQCYNNALKAYHERGNLT